MAESSRVSMDETFVFLRKGSKRRPSHIATNTVDREDILCAIPKPSYRFLLILSIVQFLIIISGSIAFGIFGHLTCKHFVSAESENIVATKGSQNCLHETNSVRKEQKSPSTVSQVESIQATTQGQSDSKSSKFQPLGNCKMPNA